ncbi:MAG: hypothetical protein OXJ52_06035 [Oligoflexia bacterium]|nr:hypothetical protein [Oligoflexia bacterium]
MSGIGIIRCLITGFALTKAENAGHAEIAKLLSLAGEKLKNFK